MSEMKTALDRMRERAELAEADAEKATREYEDRTSDWQRVCAELDVAERERDEAHAETTKAYRLKQQAERERDEALRLLESVSTEESAERERAETAENKLFAMQGRAVVAEKNAEYLLGRAEKAERERDELRRRLDDSCEETRSNIGESPGSGPRLSESGKAGAGGESPAPRPCCWCRFYSRPWCGICDDFDSNGHRVQD